MPTAASRWFRSPGDERDRYQAPCRRREKALLELRKTGLQNVPDCSRVYGPQPFPDTMLGLPDPTRGPRFVSDAVPELRRNGWRVTMAREVPLQRDRYRRDRRRRAQRRRRLVRSRDGHHGRRAQASARAAARRPVPARLALARRQARHRSPTTKPIELRTEAERAPAPARRPAQAGRARAGRPVRVSMAATARRCAFPRSTPAGSRRWKTRTAGNFTATRFVRQLAQRLQAGHGPREVAGAARPAGRAARPISSRASTGCSSCANTTSPACSPTTWVSARPCRRSRTSSRKRKRAGSTVPR